MSLLAFLSAAVVALLGLAGVSLTAYTTLRANRLRLDAEGERDEAKAQAEQRRDEAAALRAEREQLDVINRQIRTDLLDENARLRTLLRSREDPT